MRDLAITVGILLLLSALLAFTHYSYYSTDSFLWTFALFVLGPFAGWILAAEDGFSTGSLIILIPVTCLSLWSIFRVIQTIRAASRRSRLAVAGSIWLFCSSFYILLVTV